MEKEEMLPIQILPIGYRGPVAAQSDELAIDAYEERGVYGVEGIVPWISRPSFPEERRSGDAVRDLGILGGAIVAPLPTDRIIMVDVRNLDPEEKRLIDAVGIPTVPVDRVDDPDGLGERVDQLAARSDLLYLHVDADILDKRYVPGHLTPEPDGPNMETVQVAIARVMQTGKVGAFAVVSVFARGEGRERSIESGSALIRSGLEAWRRWGGS